MTAREPGPAPGMTERVRHGGRSGWCPARWRADRPFYPV